MSEGLKALVARGTELVYNEKSIRYALLRPYCKQYLYYDRQMNERVYQMPSIYPLKAPDVENLAICVTAIGCTKSFHVLMTNCVPDLHLTGDSQCFPLYTYALDGKIRRDNITDWALGQFQAEYGPDVTKRDIFHYVYGLLHSPQYRERYAENLKRELPRIPLVEDSLPRTGGEPEGNRRGTGGEPEGNRRGTGGEPEGNRTLVLPI